MTDSIGIIAGGGQFPLMFAQAAREAGRKVVIIAHKGETRPDIQAVADRLFWVKLGQFGKIIKHLKAENVRETVLLGTISKPRIFRNVWPDLKALSLWNRIKIKHDDSILRAVAGALEEEGIRVMESTLYLDQLLFPRGLLTRQAPSNDQMEDVKFGWRIAREVGKLDIGQCIVVRNRTVLAVEAIEGTDAAIVRGGELALEKAVVVKVKKPGQDFRFDLPAVGLTTIDSMAMVKASVLAVECGQALLFDADAVIREAERKGIVVIGLEERPDGELSFQ